MNNYLRPVGDGRAISSYRAHTRRTTPSSEAGVDYYCPIGTPVLAAGDGIVVDVGGSIHQATGRYVTIDLYDGRRVRDLHLSKWDVSVGRHVKRGDRIGLSGASGYGSEYFGASSPDDPQMIRNTGGPHVHRTLWPSHAYRFGRFPLEPTLDFERYVGGATAGDESSPFDPEEDDMTPEQSKKLDAVYAALFGNRNNTGKADEISWVNIGGDEQRSRYGLLPIAIHNQTLIAQQAGKLAGLAAAVEQIAKTAGSGGKIDLAAIEAAAEKGAADALSSLVLRADG